MKQYLHQPVKLLYLIYMDILNLNNVKNAILFLKSGTFGNQNQMAVLSATLIFKVLLFDVIIM